MSQKRTISYKPPGPVAATFHASSAFVRCLKGPVGSGKTSSCLMELFTRSQEQCAVDGVRRTRWAVIRNSYPQLQSTTIRSFMDWFPVEAFGTPVQTSPISHTLTISLSDGTRMEAEFLFIALDGPDAEAKLKSLEVTGAFINEASEIRRAVFDLLTSRVGRYPAKRDGGCTWSGIIMDTNPPDIDHWIYTLFEEQRPDGFTIFHQPPGDSPAAENLDNLPDGYYERLTAGKKPEWISVYVRGEYGFSFDGKPIFPEYIDATHCRPLRPDPKFPLVIGLDFGLTPAAVIAQNRDGQWLILDELIGENVGAVAFGEALKVKLAGDFPGFEIGNIWGDPAGMARAQTDERTIFSVLRKVGIHARRAPSNDFTLRREAVASTMTRLTMLGEPGFLLDPRAKVLRKGLAGAYCFKRVQVAGDERFKDTPDKNEYSHVADALQYCLIGGGAGDSVRYRMNRPLPERDVSWII